MYKILDTVAFLVAITIIGTIFYFAWKVIVPIILIVSFSFLGIICYRYKKYYPSEDS